MKDLPCQNHRICFYGPKVEEAKHLNLKFCKKCKWWYSIGRKEYTVPTIKKLLKDLAWKNERKRIRLKKLKERHESYTSQNHNR